MIVVPDVQCREILKTIFVAFVKQHSISVVDLNAHPDIGVMVNGLIPSLLEITQKINSLAATQTELASIRTYTKNGVMLSILDGGKVK